MPREAWIRGALKGIAVWLIALILSPFTAPFRTCEFPGQGQRHDHVGVNEASLVVRAPAPGRVKLQVLSHARAEVAARHCDAIVLVCLPTSAQLVLPHQRQSVLRI